MKDRYTAFEVSIEPKFTPGEGRRTNDNFRLINMTIYARDIDEAILKAKKLLNVNIEDVEVTSACMPGRRNYNM